MQQQPPSMLSIFQSFTPFSIAFFLWHQTAIAGMPTVYTKVLRQLVMKRFCAAAFQEET